MCCEYLVLKTYIRKKQLIIRANIIVVEASNSKISNRIIITTKTK